VPAAQAVALKAKIACVTPCLLSASTGSTAAAGRDISSSRCQFALLILFCANPSTACRYPRDPDFLQNVATEVTQQVHRASWHPSVGVWAGNNEIEGSLGWYSESRTNKQLFAGDYISLFVDTIRNIIKKVCCWQAVGLGVA
jgi:hypothetical protein